MESVLVRLKPYDPRRGYVLKRFVYDGIAFHQERGWYRVIKTVGDYLRGVREVAHDPNSPLAFDVATDEQAKALEAQEEAESKVRRGATDEIRVSLGRAEQPAAAAGEASEPAARPPAVKGDDKGRKERS
jgi:hypothetical protein